MFDISQLVSRKRRWRGVGIGKTFDSAKPKQDQLLKNTERLLEENAEREKLFQEKQKDSWKSANALVKAQEEQHQVLRDLTTRMGTIIERFSSQRPI
ncbi:hypothetical protein Tcan_18830 [Toxocara canis]|uniref:Uncharacterized protein n=1 Tax=Toxocara canis TaxID=6265 RepID=A0A0B2VEQ1_TOXCA|nr:hypothetical protein Tcan_18830 [Toxocara canis]